METDLNTQKLCQCEELLLVLPAARWDHFLYFERFKAIGGLNFSVYLIWEMILEILGANFNFLDR